MLKKVEQNLIFSTKRDRGLITPCCNKKNSDGKFVNYKNFSEQFGFCHSCGKATNPPPIYMDEAGNEFTWNSCLHQFEKRLEAKPKPQKKTIQKSDKVLKKYISESEIWNYYHKAPENNLIKYLRDNYGNEKVDSVKKMYILGTYSDGGTMFWMINKELKIQKLKISYYNNQGKRTNYFKVPYKNDDGYYTCLFGEHLLCDSCTKYQKIVLVESEKTAIVGAIVLPNFTWLAYGGLNGLTDKKAQVLKGFEKVLIVPDLSNNALLSIQKRAELLNQQDINVKVWDMTNGMSDEQMKGLNIYNNDLEDVFRNLENNTYNNLLN